MIKDEIGNITSPNKLKIDLSENDAFYKETMNTAKLSTAGLDLPAEVLYGKKKIRKMANTMLFSIIYMALTYRVIDAFAFPARALMALAVTALYSFMIDHFSWKLSVGVSGLLTMIFMTVAVPTDGTVLGKVGDHQLGGIQLGDGVYFLAVALYFVLCLLAGGVFVFWFYKRRKSDVHALFSKIKRRSGK